MEGGIEISEDCELSGILNGIRNSFTSTTLSSKAIDFLNKLAYFDLSDGIDYKLCRLIISRWSARTNSKRCLAQKSEAKDVLQILVDNNILSEVKRAKSNELFVRISSNLQETILAQNQENVSFIVDLANILKNICIDWCGSFVYRKQLFSIHKHLKALKWPGNTIALSSYLISQLFCNDEHTIVLDDVNDFFKTASNRHSRETDWITVQMIQIHEGTLSKSRKVMQPSDIINVTNVDGITQDIRLDEYGAWMLNQIRIYSASSLDSDHAITSVAANSLERLQKHARFCSKPKDLTLDWIITYSGREWHSFICFATLACYQTEEWLTKLCHAYIRKLTDLCAVECSEKSEYSLKDSYLSWVCLRDLVKASRVQQELISALCSIDGLKLLTMNFSNCTTAFEHKEYFVKYQAQTVIEMLTPLLLHGKSEIVAKLLKIQAFWSFITGVLVKHPFINERYNLELENDLLCACEVYLDLLVAVCSRKCDAITDEFLISFVMRDFLKTFTSVTRGASEISNPRQRHTTMYYLFTILFTLFDHFRSNELMDIYLLNEDIRRGMDEYSECDDFTFEVRNGCLEEYRKPIETFCDLYAYNTMFPNFLVIGLRMLKVPEMSF